MNPIIILEILIVIFSLLLLFLSDIKTNINISNSINEDVYASLLSLNYYIQNNNLSSCHEIIEPLVYILDFLFDEKYILKINDYIIVNNTINPDFEYRFFYILNGSEGLIYCNISILR